MTRVDAVLNTIDAEAARASPSRWEAVCRYFAGCANAATVQGHTPRDGGARIAAYLAETFADGAEPSGDPIVFRNWLDDGSRAGFSEFMDWLSDAERFRPTALRVSLEGS
jgi:hypothetical protein